MKRLFSLSMLVLFLIPGFVIFSAHSGAFNSYDKEGWYEYTGSGNIHKAESYQYKKHYQSQCEYSSATDLTIKAVYVPKGHLKSEIGNPKSAVYRAIKMAIKKQECVNNGFSRVVVDLREVE